MTDRKITDTIPVRFERLSRKFSDNNVVMFKDADAKFVSVTYRAFYEYVKIYAAGFKKLGISRNDHIGIISENRYEWLLIDIALLGIGAVDVPRGSDSTEDEILYILKHADCHTAFVENDIQLKKVLNKKEKLPLLKTIIVINDNFKLEKKRKNIKILGLKEIKKLGEKEIKKNPEIFEEEIRKGKPDDICTLIYTSGTTGEPKGVMLTHKNFIFQQKHIKDAVEIKPGHTFLSILPIWHSFERSVEYIILNSGGTIAYSKPIGKIMLEDIKKIEPHWIVSVPRIWEGIRSGVYRKVSSESRIKKMIFHFFVYTGKIRWHLYAMLMGLFPQFKKRYMVLDVLLSIIPFILITPLYLTGNLLVFKKIKSKLGKRFIAGISGGGSLPVDVDIFFQTIGIKILEGYGLTETAPVLGVRNQKAPVFSTIGRIFKDTEYKIVDKNMNLLSPGEKGELYVKGDQVMKGYYKRPKATKEVLKKGWLNTGDIAVETHRGEIKIIGRSKETIVLMGGENIEPVPIENKLLQSEYIEQAVVLGQDKKFLAALIVPNFELLKQLPVEPGIKNGDRKEIITNPGINTFFHNIIKSRISAKTGFKNFERIFRFKLLPQAFQIGAELTHTLKIRRQKINLIYRNDIKKLFK